MKIEIVKTINEELVTFRFFSENPDETMRLFLTVLQISTDKVKGWEAYQSDTGYIVEVTVQVDPALVTNNLVYMINNL